MADQGFLPLGFISEWHELAGPPHGPRNLETKSFLFFTMAIFLSWRRATLLIILLGFYILGWRLRLRVVIFFHFRRTIFVGSAVDDRLEVEVAVPGRARGLPF